MNVYKDDQPAVFNNMRRSRNKWERFSRILGLDGSDAWTSDTFFKVVVKVTLLFGLDIWVMKPMIIWNLGGFHHRVSCCLARTKIKRDVTGWWVYPPLEAVMSETGL